MRKPRCIDRVSIKRYVQARDMPSHSGPASLRSPEALTVLFTQASGEDEAMLVTPSDLVVGGDLSNRWINAVGRS